MRPIVFRSALPLLLGVLAWAGCGDPLSLLPAAFENRVEVDSMYAASGTPVTLPSGFLINARSTVRLDQVSTFDFLYEVTPDGEHLFLPYALLVNTGRTTGNSGFKLTIEDFDSITVAPQEGYVSADTVRLFLGQVYIARSALDPTCGLGIPYYAKLQVLAFDDIERKVTFRILANVNCGYRGLEVGIPKK
jgi:hypothetical protein